MLINNKLKKLQADGSHVDYTTDDLPEGEVNKYSKGGIQNIVALTPYEPLNNVTAYAVADGDKAYAVTTGSYNAYVVADGDMVYEVSSGIYNAYKVRKPAVYKNYYKATATYTSYEVEDENSNVYFTAVAGELDEEVSDQDLYSEKELINLVTVSDTYTYNGNSDTIERDGVVLEDFDTTGEVFSDTNETPFDFIGYIDATMFTKTSTVVERKLISAEVIGYMGTQTIGDTVYTDKTLRDVLTGEDPNDFGLTGDTETNEQIAWTDKSYGFTTLYTSYDLATQYEVKGFIELGDFEWTGNTKYGHRAYTPSDISITSLYSDVLMTTSYSGGDIADYNYTGEYEVASGQNAWTPTNGSQGSYCTSQILYTTKYLTTVFNPQGAKTTQSFYYTGTNAMGHYGYVKSNVTPIPQQTIYTTTMLLEEMTEGDKTDFSLTGVSYLSERSLNLSDGDCYINSNTNKLYEYDGAWTLVGDLEETMLYIKDCAYSIKNDVPVPLVSSAHRVIKEITVNSPMAIKVEDAKTIYKVTVNSNVEVTLDDALAQDGYEIDIVLEANANLTHFLTGVKWLQSLNIQTGKYYLRIHDFGYNQPIGEVKGYWV